MNLLEKLQLGTADVGRSLEVRLAEGYRAADIGQAARDLSALWETTLVMSGHVWSRSYLYNQTEDLAALGWSAAPDLHLVRRVSNDAKHGTPISASAQDVLSAVQRLEQSVASLEPLLPGLKQDIHEPRLRRIVCAIYDHFTQGETEFEFLEASPSDTWMTSRAFEEFQVSSSDEATIRAELEALSGWKYDPPAFNAFKESLRESDEELWRIAVFTAQYEDAHSIVSVYQHDRDLLRGLHRDDYESNVLATFCLVQSRVLSAGGALLDVDHLLLAAAEAGLTARRSDLLTLAQAAVSIFSALDARQLRSIVVDRANARVFADEQLRSPLVIDQQHGMLVSREGVLFVRSI